MIERWLSLGDRIVCVKAELYQGARLLRTQTREEIARYPLGFRERLEETQISTLAGIRRKCNQEFTRRRRINTFPERANGLSSVLFPLFPAGVYARYPLGKSSHYAYPMGH